MWNYIYIYALLFIAWYLIIYLVKAVRKDMSGSDYYTFLCEKCNANHHLQTYTHKVKSIRDDNILRSY
jgi:hypothetical protein